MASKGRTEKRPERAPRSGAASRRVLLVGCSELSRRSMTRLLQTLGCEVESVADGLEAVEVTATLLYSGVLMACRMPLMDGLEATHEIRTRERRLGGRLPIVGLSTEFSPEDRDSCRRSGMDGVLQIPASLAALRAVLAEHVPSADLRFEPPVRSSLRRARGG